MPQQGMNFREHDKALRGVDDMEGEGAGEGEVAMAMAACRPT